MKVFNYTILSIIYLLLSSSNYSQDLFFRQYGIEDGLPQSQISCLSPDDQDRLWIGTKNGGIAIFDGLHFKNFTQRDGLPSNSIIDISHSSTGATWIATTNGLCKYEYNQFSWINTDFKSLEIADLHITQSDQVWITTKNNGLFKVTNNELQLDKRIPKGIRLSVLTSDEFDDLHLRVGQHQILSLPNNSNSYQKRSTENNIASFTTLNGGIYIITEKRVEHLLGESLIANNEFGFDNIAHGQLLHQDHKQRVWLTTRDNGIYLNQNGVLSHYSINNGLPSNNITCLAESKDGTLWFGTQESGIFKYSNSSIVRIGEHHGLKSSNVTAFSYDSNGKTWIGTDKGVFAYNSKGGFPLFGESFESKIIHNIYRDSWNRMWVCSEQETEIYEDYNLSYISIQPNLPANCIIEWMNQFWIGTNQGLMHGNIVNSILKLDNVSDLRSRRVQSLKVIDNKLWIGTNEGLYIHNGTEVKLATNSIRNITSLTQGAHEHIWALSDLNCVAINKNDFTTENLKNNKLEDNELYHSILAIDSSVWLGTNHGLFKLQVDKNCQVLKTYKYSNLEGMTSDECNQNAIFLRSNKLWIGTPKGATLIKLKEEDLPKSPPRVSIHELEIKGITPDSIRKRLEINGLSFKLDHSKNNLLFRFTGISHCRTEHILYRYKIDDLDPDWLPTSTDNFIQYPNLPSGHFTFKVQASLDGIEWGETSEITFTIATPFWKSTWFILLLIIIAFLITLGTLSFRARRQKLHTEKLERLISERTRELTEKNAELEMLSIVASKMNEALIITDSSGGVLYINDAYVRNAGYLSLEELHSDLGTNLTIQMLSRFPNINDIIINFRNDDSIVMYDSSHKMKNGSEIWTSSTLQPIYNESGSLDKIAEVFTDITSRKRMEHTLKQNNKDITDSIRYAKKIQTAVLPEAKALFQYYPESFIINKPRDIVSGDFFWIHDVNETIIISAADCTGHGVPGAFMSIIGSRLLTEICSQPDIQAPDLALKALDLKIKTSLNQTEDWESSKDGMDIALLAINKKTNRAQFSGAFNPLFLLRDGEIIIYDSAHFSIGGFSIKPKEFYTHDIQLQSGDKLYMFSDGFIDQFGGNRNRKFSKKRFQKLLLSTCHLSMKEQKTTILEAFIEWKGHVKQIDDILIVGINVD